MTVTDQDKQIVQRMCEAMQAGVSGKDALVGLFTDDAVFIEPFNGIEQTHKGIAAIRTRTEEIVQQPRPPDFKLELDQVTTKGGELVAYWTCTSVVMPTPMKGRDTLTIRDGKIAYLKIEFVGGGQ